MANRVLLATALLALQIPLGAQKQAAWKDPSPHRVQFVEAEKGVHLEVLDWGGSGRPLVFLAGLGGTAHSFDDFAPKLAHSYHVYGITRRGFGASGSSPSGYGADRLGDDVLAVLDSLKLTRPVLVGASVGGEELSSVGSRHPDRVGGLVYLDAGFQYAFDDGRGSTMEELQRVVPPEPPSPSASDSASFAVYRAWFQRIHGVAYPESELRQTLTASPDGRVGRAQVPPEVASAVMAGIKPYSDIRVPVLAFFAVPHDLGPWYSNNHDPTVRAAVEAFSIHEKAWTEKQAKAFEAGVLQARVVRLAGANHAVFLSNEAEVLREMRAFLATLK
jgi:non-heme chloroperoxidase